MAQPILVCDDFIDKDSPTTNSLEDTKEPIIDRLEIIRTFRKKKEEVTEEAIELLQKKNWSTTPETPRMQDSIMNGRSV